MDPTLHSSGETTDFWETLTLIIQFEVENVDFGLVSRAKSVL
jgi:hypothetical protein